jgi:hypothetical protein
MGAYMQLISIGKQDNWMNEYLNDVRNEYRNDGRDNDGRNDCSDNDDNDGRSDNDGRNDCSDNDGRNDNVDNDGNNDHNVTMVPLKEWFTDTKLAIPILHVNGVDMFTNLNLATVMEKNKESIND